MNYHNITKDDILNGEGLRVVLWVAGCNHNCMNCQNPETHPINSGIEFDTGAWTEIEDELDKDYISGITISGGDPLHPYNRKDVTKICEGVKLLYPDKNIWLYTGYVYEEIKDLEVMKYIDVLVDGPFIDELKDNKLKWVGSSNQRVIRLKNGEIIDG